MCMGCEYDVIIFDKVDLGFCVRGVRGRYVARICN